MKFEQQSVFWRKGLAFLACNILWFCVGAGQAYAMDLGTVATQITSNFGAVAKLITAMAYIGGLGFALASIMKFKQHKDNPTQIPIGTPITLVFIAAALMFLPTVFEVAGTSIFGTAATAGGLTGTTNLFT